MLTNKMLRRVLRGGLGLVVALFWAFLLSSCATAPKSSSKKLIPQDHLAEIQRPDIPLVMNNRVQDWLDYFQGRGRPHFQRYLSRSRRYIPMMREILKKNGLPNDLVYLSMIESGFNPHAYSYAAASGAWQFIYQTGIRYGLKVNEWVDERRDPRKSTVAAAKYLKNLYDRYNNWYLAAAGYNAGEGKIDRAIRKYDTQDFWEMSQNKNKYLKPETKDYVPKLIAAAMIAKNPEKYRFKDIQYESPIAFKEIKLHGPIDLRVAAKCAGVAYEDIKSMNPELLRWVTPLDVREYSLKIPAKAEGRFHQKVAGLSASERLGEKEIKTTESESVERIAQREGVAPVLLALANGLSVDDRVKAGRKITIPLDPPAGEEWSDRRSRRGKNDRKGRNGGRTVAYRVKRGETLSQISKRTGLSVAELKRNNPSLRSGRVKAGQTIRLAAADRADRGRRSETKASKRAETKNVAALERPPAKSSGGGHANHTVRLGDTLSDIAKKYKVSTKALKSANGITHAKRLKPGKTLKIPTMQASAAKL